MRRFDLRRLGGAAALAAFVSGAARAADNVAGQFIVANDNGGWSWFEDERAIVDVAANKLLVGTVADGAGSGGAARNGDVDVAAVDLASGATTRFTLRDNFQADDHNSPALYIRPDGRYAAMYAGHIADNFSRWRVSTDPGSIAAWTDERTLNNNAGATYSNMHFLPNDDGGAGRLYNFVRSIGFDPNVLVSNDQGSTWSYGGRLLAEGGGGDRPYVRYASDGQRIHFLTTERHPRDFNNSIYHGYIQDGQLYNSAGVVVDDNLLDATAVAPNALTRVFAANTVVDGASMQRAWTIDAAVDASGRPVGVFSARAGGSDLDHRFFYSRWTGSAWQANQLGYAGSYLYQAENDYTGLASIDPSDVNTVYVSSPVHPATKARLYGADGRTHYELFRGQTDDGGVTWRWTPVTFNSRQDNIRPHVPQWNADNLALVWLRGAYTTYTNYNLQAVTLINPALQAPEHALSIDFGSTGQLIQAGFQAFTRAENPPGNEQTELFSSPFAVGGSVSVTVSGGDVQFRDRGDNVAGPIGDLADDFVFNAGALTLALGNLQAGDYQIVLHSHDRDFAQPALLVRIGGAEEGQMTPTTGASPAIGTASSRVAFTVDGTSPVVLSLEAMTPGDAVLNGFELYWAPGYASPPLPPTPPIDLNDDGLLDLADYLQYVGGLHTSLIGMSAEEAFKMGDLNGDFMNDYVDFRLFREAYDSWNGAGALEALLPVPEPGGPALATAAALALGAGRRALGEACCRPRGMARPEPPTGGGESARATPCGAPATCGL